MGSLTSGSVVKTFFRHLFMGFGSALVLSLYSVVDAIMVGRYEGEDGMAAVATIVPIWTIALSIGLLFGIGGATRIASALGAKKEEKARGYFTVTIILLLAVSVLAWLVLLFFDRQLLSYFGAEGPILELALLYVRPIKWVLPLVIFAQALTSFVRNDGSPLYASLAVIIGGITNIVFDYLLVFVFNLGIYGAGLATAGSESLTCLLLLIRLFFFPKRLRLVKPKDFFYRASDILASGFPSFIIDAATGIVAVFMNRQIVSYFEGEEALAIYGVIGQFAFVALSFSYAIAHASQPLIGANLGAHRPKRVKKLLELGTASAAVLGLLFTLAALLLPQELASLFMTDPQPDVLMAASDYILPYAGTFFFLTLNVYWAYFFIANYNTTLSIVISLFRSIVLPLLFIYVFPLIMPPLSLFYAMLAVEAIVSIVSAGVILIFLKKKPSRLLGTERPSVPIAAEASSEGLPPSR